MRPSLRFLIALLAGLATLTLVAHFALARITRRWFEADLEMRSRLAVASARWGLLSRWEDPERLADALSDISRDERIMAATACSTAGETRASTDIYPADLPCGVLLPRFPAEHDGLATLVSNLPAGRVHLSAVSLSDGAHRRGTVVLVHDLSFLDRREATTRNLLAVSFFVLALLASGVTLLAARLAWRRWTGDLKLALAGEPIREFQPLLRDVRDLVQRLVTESQGDARVGVWGPERLRAVLAEHLHGERVIVVSNREPYLHQRGGAGVELRRPASGLVRALEPVLRACSGVWIAHGSGDADREESGADGRVRLPPGESSYDLRRLWLSREEHEGHYVGLSNEGLWPLCHLAHERPTFRNEDWEQYVRVNQRFVDAVVEETRADNPIVLIQDYHLALAPRLLRQRLPKATILTFWHIPWPSSERFGICPYRHEILLGLLGSSILGFQIPQHGTNFLDAVDAFLESRVDRTTGDVVQGGRRTSVRAYPASIEWPPRGMEGVPSVPACREAVRSALGLPPDVALGIGVDRLDYTKGLEERLLAVDDVLERYPQLLGTFCFVQLAAPSRSSIERYQEAEVRLRGLVARLNEKWGEPGGFPPIILRCQHHEPSEVFRHFRAADVCLVTSLHDGMNLVAKEFVAARDDERGALVLSQFAGAARELPEALLVNPYDVRQTADALATALWMSEAEQEMRMRAMRHIVAEFNVYRWAGKMLLDAADLRRREWVMGRLAAPRAGAP